LSDYSADRVPPHVPASTAQQWAEVYSRVYDQAERDGDKSADEIEARAFAAANALLSRRASALHQGDFVIGESPDGVRRRGQLVTIYYEGEYNDADGGTIEASEDAPVAEVQLYKPVRDGWEPYDQRACYPMDALVKIDNLYPPGRPSRKDDHQDDTDESMTTTHVKRDPTTAVKRLAAKNRIGGYALVFGNNRERDIEGDFFTKDTDLFLDVYGAQPIFFDHAVGVPLPDGVPQELPRHFMVGRIIKSAPDDQGVWVEAIIDAHNEWVESIYELIDRGALYFSSGSVPHLIKRTENGEVKSWPIIEVSLTPTPAEPRGTRVARRDALPERTHTGKNADTKTIETIGGPIRMNKKQARRLQALLKANWTREMATDYRAIDPRGVQSLMAGKKSGSAAKKAAQQLAALVAPVAEQAEKFGIKKTTAINYLASMIVAKATKARKSSFRKRRRYLRQAPEEDFMEEGDEDFLEFGEEDFLEEGDEDFLEFGEEDFMEEGDEDFLEEGDEDFLEFDEEEDFLEEGDEDFLEFDEEEEGDFAVSRWMRALEEGDEDFLEFGEEEDFMEEGDEDFLEMDEDVTDDFIEADDEEYAVLRTRSGRSRRSSAPRRSSRRSASPRRSSRRSASRSPAPRRSYRSAAPRRGTSAAPRRGTSAAPAGRKSISEAAMQRIVRQQLSALPRQAKGRVAAKRINLNLDGGDQPESLAAFLKATRDRNFRKLEQYQRRAAGAYKAMGVNPDTAGGYLAPVEQSDQIIEKLQARSVFLRDMPGDAAPGESLITLLPLNRDTLMVPRQETTATAYWIGENRQITESEPTVGQLQLVAKKLACMVKISNELLEDSSPDVDEFLRTDISRRLALAIDEAILYGRGVGAQPLGVYYHPSVSKTALNAAPTYKNLVDLVAAVEDANVEVDETWYWLLRPRDKNSFRMLTDPAGQYIFAGTGLNAAVGGVPDTLLGYPWMTTTTVALDSSDNSETDVFFGRWRDLIIGMRKTIEIMSSNQAGESFEYDQTWIRAIMRVDIAMRHPESIGVLTDVRAITPSS